MRCVLSFLSIDCIKLFVSEIGVCTQCANLSFFFFFDQNKFELVFIQFYLCRRTTLINLSSIEIDSIFTKISRRRWMRHFVQCIPENVKNKNSFRVCHDMRNYIYLDFSSEQKKNCLKRNTIYSILLKRNFLFLFCLYIIMS